MQPNAHCKKTWPDATATVHIQELLLQDWKGPNTILDRRLISFTFFEEQHHWLFTEMTDQSHLPTENKGLWI